MLYDAYIIVKRRVNFPGTNATNKRNEKLTFKNNARFRLCISKINHTFIDNAEDFDIVMLMHNLLEFNGNFHRDRVNDDDVNKNNDVGNYRKNNKKTTAAKSFNYKTKIMGSRPDI